jgi:hypothetical protein
MFSDAPEPLSVRLRQPRPPLEHGDRHDGTDQDGADQAETEIDAAVTTFLRAFAAPR